MIRQEARVRVNADGDAVAHDLLYSLGNLDDGLGIGLEFVNAEAELGRQLRLPDRPSTLLTIGPVRDGHPVSHLVSHQPPDRNVQGLADQIVDADGPGMGNAVETTPHRIETHQVGCSPLDGTARLCHGFDL